MSFYLNNILLSQSNKLTTSAWTSLSDVTFNVNANDVLYVKTGWNGSHYGNNWGFKSTLEFHAVNYTIGKVIEEKYFTINNVKYGYFRYIKS